jgi:hypothetical protein
MIHMALTIDSNDNIYIKKDDTIMIIISTIGIIKAEVGDTAIFTVKSKVCDGDDIAVLTKDIDVIIDDEIPIYITSDETELLDEGVYHWSVKHIKGTNKYTIIPDEGNRKYPTFNVGSVMISE